MFFPSAENITLDSIEWKTAQEKQVLLSVLRLDKIHPVISGNKWFKLQYYMEEATRRNINHIITFGGAWSNHIAATAAYCQFSHLQSTGIIRGERPAQLSQTLQDAAAMGMQLVFITREAYRQKQLPEEIIRQLKEESALLVPEGGYGEKGVAGAADIVQLIPDNTFTGICAAVGTGTMIAGLRSALPLSVELTGISVLKNQHSILSEIEKITNSPLARQIRLIPGYHFSGYARFTKDLIDFMNLFFRDTGIPLDFVYTGKLFYAVNDLLQQDYFPPGSRILLIHSGGLQGNRSLEKGTLIY